MLAASGCRAGVWQHVDVLGMHGLPAVGAARDDVADLSTGMVAVEHRWPCFAYQPFVAPANHHHEHVEELVSPVGEVVLVPGAIVIGTALEDAMLDERS